MTEPDPLLDELASAHLDGTASPEEVARVAGDPALQARVDELRAVRAAVGAIPVVDPRRRDAAITAALAVYDEQPEGPKVRTPPVTSLAAVAARRRTAPVARRLVGVAAAIVLLALLVPLVAGLGERSDDDQAAETSTAFDGSDQDVPDSEQAEGGV
ncbi:MAG TPA: hypothetical protein VGP53_03655, partial [Acidimicrobiales bacterium]|nr:hypothetical protein [Acidimicrobiales bacterium]